MDHDAIDRLARLVAASRSRRTVVQGLVGGLLGLGVLARVAPASARRHKHHHHHHGGGGGLCPNPCPPATPDCCGQACTDVMTDPNNCGACGTRCPANQSCANGACRPDGGGGPTCADGVQNGSETDVDCGGGTCPRCADGQRCLVAEDCQSGVCANGQCVACAPTQLCGSDAGEACRCDVEFMSGEPVCDAAAALGFTVDDCAKCPAGTESCVTINGLLFNCYARCGATG